MHHSIQRQINWMIRTGPTAHYTTTKVRRIFLYGLGFQWTSTENCRCYLCVAFLGFFELSVFRWCSSHPHLLPQCKISCDHFWQQSTGLIRIGWIARIYSNDCGSTIADQPAECCGHVTDWLAGILYHHNQQTESLVAAGSSPRMFAFSNSQVITSV